MGPLVYRLGEDETTPPPSPSETNLTIVSSYNIHLHMSLSSSAAPVADIETYSGMCGRCEEAGGR